MEFHIFGQDLPAIESVMKEFCRLSNLEVTRQKKGRLLKTWSKLSNKVGLQTPEFFFLCIPKKDYVEFYVNSTYGLKMLPRAKEKLLGSIAGALAAKKVMFDKIEVKEEVKKG